MSRRQKFLVLLLSSLLLLAGCAETKYVLQLHPEDTEDKTVRVWPAAPEKARFQYVGELIGQQNLVADGINSRNAGEKLFYWLVGLISNEEDMLVLKRPQSGVVDAQGRIYVTDVANHAVFVFDQANPTLRIWDQAQEKNKFVTPIGIVVGAEGQILVADAELGRVFRLSRDGKPMGSFGQGLLERPTGLARDAQRGQVYVADTYAHDIKVFDDNGKLLHTIGHRGEGDGELNFPTYLAFAEDKLYVTDGMNARLQVFDREGKILRTIGRRGLKIGDFTRPKGVTVDASGNIYVVESFFDSLLVFNAEGSFLMPIGGTGKEIGQFYLPAGVWSDARGRIYVADMFNGRIVIFQFLGGT